MNNVPQVDSQHYFNPRYVHKERWVNYWYQLNAIFQSDAKNILEIGVGNGIVLNILRSFGKHVETVDIDVALNPDIVASAESLPLDDDRYDFVLCAEVLEHLPIEGSRATLRELQRVSRKWVLVTLPYAGSCVTLCFKIPFIQKQEWILKIPHWWKSHSFNGQHYWEVGKKGFLKRDLKKMFEDAGFVAKDIRTHADDPAHIFALLLKRETQQ